MSPARSQQHEKPLCERRLLCAMWMVPLWGLLIHSVCAQTPLPAQALHQGGIYRLSNAALAADLEYRQDHIKSLQVHDLASGGGVRDLSRTFAIAFATGAEVTSSSLVWHHAPIVTPLRAGSSTRTSEQFGGQQICDDATVAPQLEAQWCLVLRDGSPYVRQTLQLRAEAKAAEIRKVTLIDVGDANARVAGTVAGSPLVDDRAFFAFEHPLAHASVSSGSAIAALDRTLPLQPGTAVTYSSVIGFAQPGQMRRTFLAYLERERAHPYRPFLTYNSWYDLGTGERYGAQGALNRVQTLGEELVRKRNVKLDSYLFDDGWDNPASFWQFNSGFPQGMGAVKDAAASFGAGIGFWLSPWGGYDEAKLARIRFGTDHGYEIVKGGYALSGPRYFKAFEEVGDKLLTRYGANQFKIDGTGNASQTFPGSAFDSDFDAAIHLLSEWRARKADLFLNLTTGTYPSPFWLMYADSIWRGGEDHSFAGVGSWRQQWITYRDGQTYKNIVRAGPLFPLNSLMLHSIIYGRGADHLGPLPSVKASDDQDFADEVWTFFGSGTDLQELYITPSLLNPGNWDQLAAGARWSHSNSAILRDTHWVGGDPAALQPYGWASWTPDKAILVLRNPSDHMQPISLDAQAVFELPAKQGRTLDLHEARPDARAIHLKLTAGAPVTVSLQPFAVYVLETGDR